MSIAPRPTPVHGLMALALSIGLTIMAPPFTGSPGVRADTEHVVRITSRGIEPRELTVPAGSLVAFVNEDDARHRMRSRDGSSGFDTGDIEPGGSEVVPLDEAGTFAYIDERNDEARRWQGTIVVTPPVEGPPATEASVGMLDEVFRPGRVTITAGGTVTWTNDDGDEHTVTGQGFDSGILVPGASFSHTFAEPGAFVYGCLIHAEMQGTVEVVAGAPGASPQPGASPLVGASPDPGASDGPGTSAEPGASGEPVAVGEPAAVAIVDFAMSPITLAIPAGTEVTFSNEGQAPHSATARDGTFDSGVMSSGGTYAFTFETPGTWEYFCIVHPSMTGAIEVLPASGESAGGSPSPALAP